MNLSAAEIIKALGGNSSGMCCCPAHDDDNPSLHVTEKNGKVLFHCHAGCPQEDVIAALEQKGLWQKPYSEKLTWSSAHRQKSRTHSDEAYDEYERWCIAWGILYVANRANAGYPAAYLHGRGIGIVPPCAKILPTKDALWLLHKKLPAMVCPVTDGKKLIGAQVTWLTRDSKAKCDGTTSRQLYGTTKGGYIRLGKVEPDKPLIIGEGVETTLAAMVLADLPGIAALSATNMPAVKVPPSASVIIAADHDKAGRKAAAALAERLEYEGRKVKLAFPPDEGTDWNDVLLHSDDAEADWQGALKANAPETHSGPITALEEDEFMTLAFPKRDPLLAPWLPRAALVMIHAQRGEGKTWLALAVGKAIANGEDLLGWPCTGYARVLYVDGELPGTFLQDRISKFRQSPPGMFHVLCRDAYLLKKQTMPNLGEPEGRTEMDRIIARCKPAVVILDSLSTLIRSGVENEAESWAPVQDWLLKHRWQGRTVILVHHEGKSGKPRGSSKREDVLDTMVGLRKNEEGSTATESVFDLSFTKTRDFFGDDAAPMQINLKVTDGLVTWSHQKVRDVRLERIREMQKAGARLKDIAKELEITPGRVSQILKEQRRKDDNVVPFQKRDKNQGEREGD